MAAALTLGRAVDGGIPRQQAHVLVLCVCTYAGQTARNCSCRADSCAIANRKHARAI
jgi:hypothetical protein